MINAEKIINNYGCLKAQIKSIMKMHIKRYQYFRPWDEKKNILTKQVMIVNQVQDFHA
jgi:hypothetical protein